MFWYCFIYNKKKIIAFWVARCEGPFLDSVQAQAEARTLGLVVVVWRDWA